MARRAAKQAERVVEYAGTPRDMIPHDHPEYAYRTLEELKRYWAMAELNEQSFGRAWADAMEAQIWKRWPPDSPYKSLNRLCLEEFGTTKAGVTKRLTRAQQRVAEEAVTVGDVGTNQHSGGRDNVTTSAHRGNDADYLVARLKRDHENVWADLRDGKYKTVRAAARAAGIPIKEYAQVPRTVEGFAAAARKYLSADQLRQLADLLTDEVEETG